VHPRYLLCKVQEAMKEKKRKILVIDDEVIFLHVLVPVLEAKGEYEVMPLINTRNLIDRIDKFKPDIILLDIMMPDADGIEVCRRLKENIYTKSIPVVMLSAMSRDKDVQRASQAGADDFIAKPARIEDLIKKIEEVLCRKQ
jgi:CheY-like chemotaxis protein